MRIKVPEHHSPPYSREEELCAAYGFNPIQVLVTGTPGNYDYAYYGNKIDANAFLRWLEVAGYDCTLFENMVRFGEGRRD